RTHHRLDPQPPRPRDRGQDRHAELRLRISLSHDHAVLQAHQGLIRVDDAWVARVPGTQLLRRSPTRARRGVDRASVIRYPQRAPMENSFGKPVEVEVRDSLEKAMKILKQKMSKEGILQELKRRRFYEKPSVKRKRKTREARKRLRREMK